MTTQNLIDLFKTHDAEYGKFDRVINKLSKRADIHALMLLDEILPDSGDMISAAEHDEIFLDVNLQILAEKITQEQVIELIRCAVSLDNSNDSLTMFV